MNKKYKLEKAEGWLNRGKQLYRVVALHDFGANPGVTTGVKKGEVGGLVESEENLSHSGDCWIGGNARVVDRAKVCHDAYVGGNAQIKDSARVGGCAVVKGRVRVTHRAVVLGLAFLEGKERIGGIRVFTGDDDQPLNSPGLVDEINDLLAS